MTLAYLTSQYARASDTFIRLEVQHLRRMGHTVHTFSIRRPRREDIVGDEVRREYEATDYIVSHGALRLLLALTKAMATHPWRVLTTARLAWSISSGGIRAACYQLIYLAEAAYLAQRLRSLGVEHLHNHLAQNSATVAMLASAIAGIPYSLTVHGPYEFYTAEKWALSRKVERSAFTACISEFCRSQCMVFTAVHAWDRLHVVRCAVAEEFMADDVPSSNGSRRFVTVGRLVAEKGYMVLAEAVRRLAGEGLSFEVRLIGDGPLRADIEAFVRQHGLQSHLTLSGWASPSQIRQNLLDARALIHPSFAEGLPVVIMEALALHRPVIATAIAGVPELVEEGVCGWLVPPSSVDALAIAMRKALLAPEEMLSSMGRAGAERVAARHNAAAEVGKLAALFTGARTRA